MILKKTFLHLLLTAGICLIFFINTSAAYQITPNPNPIGETITITGSDAENSEEFDNRGIIDIEKDGTLVHKTPGFEKTFNNFGKIINNGTFKSHVGATSENWYTTRLYNSGEIVNQADGVIEFNSEIISFPTGQIKNFGMIQLNGFYAGLINLGGLFSNFSGGTVTVENNSLLENEGEIKNFGKIINKKIFRNYNDGLISNLTGGVIENNSEMKNYNNGRIENTGTITNKKLLTNKSSLKNLINGRIENIQDGTIENTGNIINESILANYGTIKNNQNGLIENNFLFFNSTTTSRIENTGTITNKLYIQNFGTVSNQTGGVIENKAGFDNFRIVENAGLIKNNSIFFNPGTTTNLASGVIENNGTFKNDGTFDNQGTYSGSGSFKGQFINSGGTLAPGSSPGTATIDGDLMFDSGILQIEIGGTADGDYDQLFVTGSADMTAGVFEFSQWNSYGFEDDILAGEIHEWEFLHADGGIDGFDLNNFVVTFTTDWLLPGFDATVYLDSTATGLWLTVSNTNENLDPGPSTPGASAVPEPSTILLLGMGLLGISRFSRRKACSSQ